MSYILPVPWRDMVKNNTTGRKEKTLSGQFRTSGFHFQFIEYDITLNMNKAVLEIKHGYIPKINVDP